MEPTLALSSWSCHSEFFNGRLHPKHFPSLAVKQYGVRHVEFYEGDFSPNFVRDPNVFAIADELAAQCRMHKVGLVAISAINDLTTADATDDLNRLRKWLKLAPTLGFKFLRVNSGMRRLNQASAATLAKNLQTLVREAEPVGTTVVLENHPHTLRNNSDSELLVSVIRAIDRPNVGICADVGSFAPGYWLEGFTRLAPYAKHTHIKPSVKDELGNDIPIHTYLPQVVRILKEASYRGYLTFEYTEFKKPDRRGNSDIKAYLQQAATVLRSYLIETPASPAPSAETDEPIEIVKDPKISPGLSLLKLLADGCQAKLNSDVTVHDFGLNKSVFSKRCVHRPEHVPKSAQSFCGIVQTTPDGKARCHDFHQTQLKLVEQGTWKGPTVCPCPMGLMTLTVPIANRHRVFGSISCGPWIENGTEGMVSLALSEMPISVRSLLEEAMLEVEPLETLQLQGSKSTLEQLARDLGDLYDERFWASESLESITSIVDSLRDHYRSFQSEPMYGAITPEKVVSNLESVLLELLDSVRMGGLVFYSLSQLPDTGFSRLIRIPTNASGVVTCDPEIDVEFDDSGIEHVRTTIADAFRAHGLKSITTHASSAVMVFFLYEDQAEMPSHHQMLITRLISEVEYSINGILHVADIQRRETGSRVFFARLKHALSGSLTAIDRDVRKLKKLLYSSNSSEVPVGKKTQLRLLHSSLEEHNFESGDILKRLVGRVRLSGPAALRPKSTKRNLDVVQSFKVSQRKISGVVRQRSISLQVIYPPNDSAMILGDSEALTEVIDNLLDNALKYTESSGVIRCDVVYSDSRSVKEWRLAGQTGVKVSVTNTAKPIPESDLVKIFEPLVQGSNEPPIDRSNKGTGMGLAICREIVEDHGGAIYVSQTEAKVPTSKLFDISFHVDLPIGQLMATPTDNNTN